MSAAREESLTLRELVVLDHATAWSRGRKSRLTRNRYLAGEGHDSWESLLRLCSAGLMERRPGHIELTGGDDLFVVTEAGIEALKRWRP